MRPTYLPALAAIAALLLVSPPSPARAGNPELPAPHGDKLVKERLARFEKEFAAGDMDERIHMIKWIALHRHKKVLARLKKIWLKERDLELVAAAGAGLGQQTSFPKAASRVVLQGLDKYRKLAGKTPRNDKERMQEDLEARVLVNGIQSYQALGLPIAWKRMKGLIDHNNDDVAIAFVKLCQARKEYRALPVIYEWFEYYPDGVSWSGGSVRVDTGAAGNKDANAARAKWKAKYGSRAKKARPNAFQAMVECVQALTGEKIEKRDQLKAWMEKNRAFLKKHGV